MNDALTAVRRLLVEGQISIEDLVDLIHEQLDLIERGDAFADTTTWMTILDFAKRVQQKESD
jgi:hypothetical protein